MSCRPGLMIRPLSRYVCVIAITISAVPVIANACNTPVECIDEARHTPFGQRVKLLLQAHEHWPSDTVLSLETARACIAAEQYEEALQVLKGDEATNRELAAELRLQKALVYMRLGKADEAIRLLKPYARGALANGVYTRALSYYVHAIIDLNRQNEAESILSRFSPEDLEPRSRSVYLVELARLAICKSEGEKALNLLSNATDLVDNSHVTAFKALVHVWKGDLSAAKKVSATIPADHLRKEYQSIPALITQVTKDQEEPLDSFREQIQNHAYEQAGYLLLAACEWKRENTRQACEAIKQGRQHARSTTLLSPPWLKECH